MNELHARAKAFRGRVQIRAWEHRQLEGSKGTWYRVRRLLARAEQAFVVNDETMQDLLRAGAQRQPVGDELEPNKNYVLLSASE